MEGPGIPNWPFVDIGYTAQLFDIVFSIQQTFGPAGWDEQWNHLGPVFYFRNEADLMFFQLKIA